jgi:hypothetical protein
MSWGTGLDTAAPGQELIREGAKAMRSTRSGQVRLR